MSKYKIGDKVVLTISDVNEKGYYPYYVFNNDNLTLWKSHTDKSTEPLSTYTEPLEDTIQKYTVKIARMVMEKEELKDENERLKAENEKMSVKIDAYELCGDQHEEEYNQAFNQGAEAAWELARKINDMDIYDTEEIFIEAGAFHLGNVLENYTYPEAAAKVTEWEKAKEEIEVGDVIKINEDSDFYGLVININSESRIAFVVSENRSLSFISLECCIKTGRHIDVDSFLKQIGGKQE